MRTEAEAKLCWCPFARLAIPGPSIGFNRAAPADLDSGPIISAATCCIASACMAWRWLGRQHYDDCAAIRTQTDMTQAPCDCNAQAGWCGYCGLADKPE